MKFESEAQIEIINTGSELMLGYVLNSHQQWLCRQLSDRGYRVARQVAVTDQGSDIQAAVRDAMLRSNLIITTGGLGPTSDDCTRERIAELLGARLKEDAEIVRDIENFFGKRKRPMPSSTRVQAMVPEGATVLANRHGTAPGLVMPFGGGLLAMLPGPPRELRPMFIDQVLPIIEQRFGAPAGYACCVLKSSGMGESFVEERIAPELRTLVSEGLEIGYCARVGEVDIRLIARGENAAGVVSAAEEKVRDLLRGFVYGRDPDQLDTVVVQLLTERQRTLALAESCTGGYIANRITNIPGASAVFRAGLITYSNEAKEHFLAVKSSTLSAHGAVSEAVAHEMAEGARRHTGADFALSITGIAGPSGGTPGKPVGTVFIGLAAHDSVQVKKLLNQFDRETFKFLTSQQALEMLRRKILRLD